MLHEVLLALSGFTGDVFVEDETGFHVSLEFPFQHNSEKDVLNKLARLGFLYKKLNDFIEFHDHQTPIAKSNTGLYLKALSSGLDTILQPYRETLLQAEQAVLKDSDLPVSYLQHLVEPFHILLLTLDTVIQEIVELKVRGCRVLHVLYQHSVYGNPVVQEAMQRILQTCHGVMYKQLLAWFLHGTLMDTHHEFFIRKVISEERSDSAGGEDTEQTSGSSNVHEFVVAYDLLPSYLPQRVAEKVLFVGEAVQLFSTRKTTGVQQRVLSQAEESVILSHLAALQRQQVFNLIEFESMVDEVKSTVTQHLWQLLVEESDLLGQLHVLKDYFLLGRGELFLVFIDLADNLLKEPVADNTEHDVNQLFKQAFHKVTSDDDDVFQHFYLSIDQQQVAGVSSNSWDRLSLTYRVDWPLHIVFTPPVLQKFNMLFKFFLIVKRAQLALQHAWAQQMVNKGSNDFMQSRLGALWRLRYQMAFLVNNLQYYLQVDVLESQYSILTAKMKSSKDFEENCLAMDTFLSSVLAQSFLLVRPNRWKK
ncbi:gamma-tubulin complex component 4-like isoform X2 [Corticium candelabrum]|uniref:gamma-tubulin complex component 4-like isoform X2 n=1 Tax=Corticium candelabrum TaxID=121492 RepID=UPI002E25AD25|nr:gamma-tubulin complex component 4-like isoform X2 [Corticium candelabrum]